MVYNPTKRDIPNYIGANTLIEMGLIFYLKKPIYVLYGIPDISYKEEIEAMRPILLRGDLSKIDNLH